MTPPVVMLTPPYRCDDRVPRATSFKRGRPTDDILLVGGDCREWEGTRGLSHTHRYIASSGGHVNNGG